MLSRVMQLHGLRFPAMDIAYWERSLSFRPNVRNPLDMLGPAGFACLGSALMYIPCVLANLGSFRYQIMHCWLRLILLQALKAKPGGVFHFGLVCGSWVALSRFSSGSRYLCPMGDQSLPWVVDANVMVSRLATQVYVSWCMCMIYMHVSCALVLALEGSY